jgi:uncharacterized protein with PIN domain
MKGHRSREEIRAELLAEAETLIDKAFDWDDETEAPTLRDIEQVVLKLRKRFGERMAEAMIERQEERWPVRDASCPECGAEMQYKGQKESDIESQVGALGIEKGYYYCAQCRRGLFPPR